MMWQPSSGYASTVPTGMTLASRRGGEGNMMILRLALLVVLVVVAWSGVSTHLFVFEDQAVPAQFPPLSTALLVPGRWIALMFIRMTFTS